MVIHVQIASLGLRIGKNFNGQLLLLESYGILGKIKVLKFCCLFTFKLEFLYLALLSNLMIFSGHSSLIACFSMNQGDISALTSSGIFESRLVCWFIITQVLFHVLEY
jgi:hypothetical protein